jgi:hypothetical protein
MSTTVDQWLGSYRRRDGVTIEMTEDGWTILTGGGTSLTTCPCCGLSFRSARNARLVADAVFPLEALEQ